MKPFRCGLIVAAFCGLLAEQAAADITWNITYADVGTGFDDPIEGAARRATIDAVTDYINSVLDVTGTVDFHFNPSLNVGNFTTPLASAGPNFTIFPDTVFTNGDVFDHAVRGENSFTDPDGTAQFDFGYTWNSDLSAPAPNEFDLFSVALHEMTHALGFLSLMAPNGASVFGDGVYSVLDSFLELEDGTDLLDEMGNFVGNPDDLTSGDVVFDGPNARSANGGNPVPIFSPDPFNVGSSLSHIVLDDAVMEFSIPPGVMQRTYTAVELGMLADIGWTIQPAAVPEPSSMVLLSLVGIASVGCSRWRRRVAA